jgi:hypothetical protein
MATKMKRPKVQYMCPFRVEELRVVCYLVLGIWDLFPGRETEPCSGDS